MQIRIGSLITVALALLALQLIAVSSAYAETLIFTQDRGYQLPANADIVRVNRTGGAAWVPVAEVQPTERILVCVDGPVTVGSTSSTACTTRVPGRTDNWQLKSLAIPEPLATGSVTFEWNPVTTFDNGAPIANLAGYTVSVKHQDCDPATANCAPAAFEMPLDLGNVTRFTVTNVKHSAGLIVQGRLTDGTLGPLSDEGVGFPPKLKPAKVTGVRQVADLSPPTGSVTLDWTMPTLNTDGTALTDPAGFRVLYGTSPSTLTQSVSLGIVDTHTVEGLSPGPWHFAVRTRNSAGDESPPSNSVSKTVN